MLHRPLKLHPDSRCEAVARIDVTGLRFNARMLQVIWTAAGSIPALRLAGDSADPLWQHTCFEVFVRAAGEKPYREFNFAPSRQWAGYAFDSYRGGMRDIADSISPRIDVMSDEGRLSLEASFALPEIPAGRPWRLAVSAVIEEADGRFSYWALAHPAGKADFHHPDCFALELPPP